jgi:hypothetical protein
VVNDTFFGLLEIKYGFPEEFNNGGEELRLWEGYTVFFLLFSLFIQYICTIKFPKPVAAMAKYQQLLP